MTAEPKLELKKGARHTATEVGIRVFIVGSYGEREADVLSCFSFAETKWFTRFYLTLLLPGTCEVAKQLRKLRGK